MRPSRGPLRCDEYMIVLPDDDTPYEASAKGESRGRGLPAAHRATRRQHDHLAEGRAQCVRLFSTQIVRSRTPSAPTLRPMRSPIPRTLHFKAWPAPPDGYKLRGYEPPERGTGHRGKSGPIWRCTTIMLNFPPTKPPRARRHEDVATQPLRLRPVFAGFAGNYIHHMRWPWGLDKNGWREDEHAYVGGAFGDHDPGSRHPHLGSAGARAGRQSDGRYLLAAAS